MNIMKTTFAAVAILGLFSAGCKSGANENLFPISGDVGAAELPGFVSYEGHDGVTTLTGSGANMWGTTDEFFMNWREMTGDFSLSADLSFEGEGVNAHRKMGLIVRASTDPAAAYADVAMHGDGLVSLQYRSTQGAETQEVVGLSSGSELPARVALERKGNTIVMKISAAKQGMSDFNRGRADARDWLYGEANEVTIELPENCLVGLFICSHDAAVSETGHFSNIKLERL